MKAERNVRIMELRNQGLQYATIARMFGVTDNRIWQICHRDITRERLRKWRIKTTYNNN